MVPRKFLPALVLRQIMIFVLAIAVGFGLAATQAGAQQPAPAAPGDTGESPLTQLLRSITGYSSKPAPSKFKRTRFVIDLERSARFEVSALVNPNRIVLHLPRMRWNLPSVSGKTKGSLVTGVRGGVSAPGKMQVIIKVAAPAIVENPHIVRGAGAGKAQLRLDIVPAPRTGQRAGRPDFRRKVAGLGGIGLQPPVPRTAASAKRRGKEQVTHTIVIDPGHGGHDSGAKKHGVREKDAVLAVGKLLRDKLRAFGHYRVLMTRDTDVFVPLSERRRFAEKHKANLFISVHADYARSSASGATIYSLRDRVAKRLKKSARKSSKNFTQREVKAMHSSGSERRPVRGILQDLALRDVNAASHRTGSFTQTVIKHMGQSTDMRSKPHRSAAFKVLKTQSRPAVLIELAYVSNRRDARRLQSKAWRNKVSNSIAIAIDNYLRDGSRLALH